MAWYCGNSNDTTHPVGEKEANPFGLYDVHGNVFEWVYDVYRADYEMLSEVDPVNTETGFLPVLRGGSLFGNTELCRAARRKKLAPTSAAISTGFRLVRTIQ